MKSRVYLTSSAVTLLFALAAAPIAGCGHDPGGAPHPPSSPAPSSPPPPSLLFPCDDPGSLKVAGQETGYAFCTGGPVYRAKAQTCPTNIPHDTGKICHLNMEVWSCKEDAECATNPNGFCSRVPKADSCSCQYGCTTDAECDPGSICMCEDPVGRCVLASCTSNADCKEGALCAEYVPTSTCDTIAFACQDELDECQMDRDCEDSKHCTIVMSSEGASAHRTCGSPLLPCPK